MFHDVPPMPGRLYKYTDAEALSFILRNRTLRWSSPELFNDPFDGKWDPHWLIATKGVKEEFFEWGRRTYLGQVNWADVTHRERRAQLSATRMRLSSLPKQQREALVREVLEANWKKLQSSEYFDSPKRRALIRRTRMFCLSATEHSLLMWSHYGDKHAGAMLEFDPNALSEYWLIPPMNVRYRPDLPPPIPFKEWFGSVLSEVQPEFGPQPVINFILTKAKCWEYEAEWRFAELLEADTEALCDYRPFPATALRSIHFGCRMRPEDAAVLRELVQKFAPASTIYFAKQQRLAFGLESHAATVSPGASSWPAS